MKIELILIASEILEGKITDLNGHWLAHFLNLKGLSIEQVTVVRDHLPTLLSVTNLALQRSDVVITSGGIGPTADDLTKFVYRDLFNLALENSPQAYKIAEKNYQRFDKIFEAKFNNYHFIPRGVTPLNNPKGLAPGLSYFLANENKYLFSLPGVPYEFQSMFTEEVFPLIEELEHKSEILREHFNVRTKLIPEEKIFGEICPNLWQELESFGQVSSLPQVMGIDIGVSLEAHHQEDLDKKKNELLKLFSTSSLTPNIWHFGHESIEEVIVSTLSKKKQTLSGAESCTGGLCSNRITDVSGSSTVFLGSIISYSNQVKIDQLHVSPESLEKFGAVSEEVAIEMAKNARKLLNSDFAYSLTGIAGPSGGSIEKPVGTVWIGISDKRCSWAKKFQFKGDRKQLKLRFSQMCFYLLLDEILSSS